MNELHLNYLNVFQIMSTKTTELLPVLKNYNPHERDSNIQFEEVEHKYTILCDLNSKYTSVTTWNHEHFENFDADKIIKNIMKSKKWKEGHKYWGLTCEQIKEQWKENATTMSSYGTDMHYNIECFMNNPNLKKDFTHKDLLEYYQENKNENENENLEWIYFLKFLQDFPNLKPYRTEWTIYDESLKLAGSIDMVYENEDGTLSIYDWKRSKNITTVNPYNKFSITKSICHLPDSNFWHYSLQLNTYKCILEKKYNKKVKDLYLIRIHPNCEEDTYELIKIPDLSKEINDLFIERLKILNF